MAVTLIKGISYGTEKTCSPRELFSGLDSAILLANSLKTVSNTHAADATEHTGSTGADVTNYPITAADASNLATLITLVTALLTAYDAHDADAELGAAWVFHAGQENADASLASAVAPTTLDECVTKLNDLKAKLNTHVADSTNAHTDGDSGVEATADSTNSIEITDSWADMSEIINCRGAQRCTLYLKYDVGTSVDSQIQALVYMENPNNPNAVRVDPYKFIIETVTASKVDAQGEVVEAINADLSFLREFVLNESVPFIKFQIKDSADGTGQLDAANIVFGKLSS